MEFWPSSERKPMKLHIDVNAQAEKEEDMHEDKNGDPTPPQFVFPASGRGCASNNTNNSNK